MTFHLFIEKRGVSSRCIELRELARELRGNVLIEDAKCQDRLRCVEQIVHGYEEGLKERLRVQ